MANTVVALCAFVVSLDVYVEMAGAAFNVSLDFGPFDSEADASKWVDDIEAAHAKRHALEVVLAEGIFDTEGLPTRPYLDVHLSMPIIMQSPLVRQNKDFLLVPKNVEEVEPKLGAYALRAAFQRLGYACQLLDTEHQ